MELTLFRPEFQNTVTVPSSKSELHRLILCALLSKAPVTIRFDGRVSDDLAASLGCAAALGARASVTNDLLTINPPARFIHGSTLDCRSSGTTLRFFLCLCAALGTGSTLLFSDALAARPLSPLTESLRRCGAVIEVKKNTATVKSGVTGCDFLIPGHISSQFVSGLLFACAARGGTVTLSTPAESRDYIGMTEKALADFGCPVNRERNRFSVKSSCPFSAPAEVAAGGDWSNAAYALIGGAIGKKSVSVCGLSPDSAQGDKILLKILRENGVKIEENSQKITVFPSVFHGFSVCGRDIPDIVPPLCVLAAYANGVSELTQIDRLRFKETDRAASTAALINALGGRAEITGDTIRIYGTGLSGGRVNGCGDHRTVMTATLAATVCANKVIISGAEAVNKSFPAFFSQFKA